MHNRTPRFLIRSPPSLDLDCVYGFQRSAQTNHDLQAIRTFSAEMNARNRSGGAIVEDRKSRSIVEKKYAPVIHHHTRHKFLGLGRAVFNS